MGANEGSENVAELSTRLLRTDPTPFWSRLRFLIKERGHEPAVLALADLIPGDGERELGVLVTTESNVYEFDLVRVRGDGHRPTESFIRDWRDRADWWRDTPCRNQIKLALELLDAERVHPET